MFLHQQKCLPSLGVTNCSLPFLINAHRPRLLTGMLFGLFLNQSFSNSFSFDLK